MRHTSLPPRLDGDDMDPTSAVEDHEMETNTISDGDTALPAQPPPHIAARFNRPSRPAMSRKSSASSSRRNSLSSLHSGRSNRSCHGGPYSTHVAQHLRRASILDARRAKLAEKAAHAEQVRMRAQQARNIPRNGKTPEERAQAAQEAREKHLAQVAAACAEEVKRARRVAEDMKEKKEKDEERMRQELEEKHANAEKRRLLFEQQREMRRRRNSSNSRIGGLPAVQETRVKVPTWKPKNKDTAARVVQKAWREYRLRKIIGDFLQIELDVEHIQALCFEEASELLLQDRVVAVSEQLLRQAHMLDMDETAAARGTSVRTFLSSYLVLCHPQQVLSKNGAQEEDLINKAKVLIMEVQRLLAKPATMSTFSKSSEIIEALCKAHAHFQSAFKAWKDGDTSFMVETMLLQFVELDAIWQTVKDDTTGGVANDYRQGIRQNQTMILVRLKRLTGPEKAKQLISDAIRKRRKEDAAKKKVLQSKPRAAGSSTNATPVLEQSRSTLTPPSSREPVFSSKDLAQVVAPLPDNRTMVHELALDRQYRIDGEKTREVRENLRRIAFRAMRDDLVNGRGDEWIISMVKTVREKILRTLQPGKGMHNMISEALDAALIRQELAAGNFNHERFFNFMGTVLPKLVSPARDAEVRAFARDDTSDVTERLDKLFRIIDCLSLDYSNYLLSLSAPKLVEEAPNYEQTCFTEQYGPGIVNLLQTRQWWRAARSSAVADLARRPSSPPHNQLTPPGTPSRSTPSPTVAIRPTADRIYSTGLIELYTGTPPVPGDLEKAIPETLLLDKERIKEARLSVLRMITTSTVILTAKNALKRDVRSPWRNISQRLLDIQEKSLGESAAGSNVVPDVDAISANFLTVFESAQVLPPQVKNMLSGTIRRVVGDMVAIHAVDSYNPSREHSHPVMRVLLSKLRVNILGRIFGSEEEKKRRENAAADALATAGLVEHLDRVKVLVEDMQKIKRVDQAAHGTWLDKIRDDVEKKELV